MGTKNLSLGGNTVSTSNAVDIICQPTSADGVPLAYMLGQELQVNTSTCAPEVSKSTLNLLYQDADPWIRNNVVEDILYLNKLRAGGDSVIGMVSETAIIEAAMTELTATLPTNQATKDALCTGSAYWDIFANSTTHKVCNNYIAHIDFTAGATHRGNWTNAN